MTTFFILAACFMIASATYLFSLLGKIVSAWWLHEWMMERGEKFSARIVAIKVMDDESRAVPFVRMKLEINAGESIFTAEGFYGRSELAYLQVGNFVSAVLHQSDKKKLQLVREKSKAPSVKEPITVLSIPPKQKQFVA